ncbi:hypothetical protein ACYVVD_02680 [Arenicellales bacterium IMCC58067]
MSIFLRLPHGDKYSVNWCFAPAQLIHQPLKTSPAGCYAGDSVPIDDSESAVTHLYARSEH